MRPEDRIFVAGHRGMVGSACVRALKAAGFYNIVTRTHAELDLMDQRAVREFYEAEKPDVAVIAAARVGGIGANSAANSRFLYENELIALNTVWGAAEAGVKRLLFLGSTCIYPRMAPQPIPESALLTSELEKTNEGYALAKISGLKLCEFLRRERGLVYHSLMPTNLYGPGDNYDIEHGHVLPTMIRKFETARTGNEQKVTLWGSGSPLREFLHVDDLASACLFLLQMENPPDLVNVGSGREVTIRQLAEMVKEATGCRAFIEWVPSKDEILMDGDIINVDVSTILDGYFADSSRMFMIGNVSDEDRKLVEVTREAMMLGLEQVKPWAFMGDMGQAVNDHAKAHGYSVVREIGGHGVGLEFHEEPWVSYVTKKGTEILLVPGMIFTIEPMINMGGPEIFVDEENDWTVYTDDGSKSAQWEIQVLVTEDGHEVLSW